MKSTSAPDRDRKGAAKSDHRSSEELENSVQRFFEDDD